jgi:glycosyltransferase involved in cell wall biosynthesis
MIGYSEYSLDTRIRREADSLIGKGDLVDYIGLREKNLKKNYSLESVNVYQMPIKRYRGDVKLFYLFSYFVFFLFASIKVSFLFFKKHYQFIQVHTMPDFMVFTAIIPKLFGAKVILDVHDLVPELYCTKYNFNEHHFLIRFITWIERRSIAFAHSAIAVHDFHLDVLVKHGNPREKFTVLLNVPDISLFLKKSSTNTSGSIRNGSFRLIYHGTVSKRYGLEIAIRAVKRLKEKIPGISLQILGGGDDVNRLIVFSKEMGVDSYVNFSEEFIPVEHLIDYIRNAHLGVIPLVSDGFTKYILPTKLLEYVALGIPVITTRTETIVKYFDDTMVSYFQSGDVDELAHKILYLYNHEIERTNLLSNAKTFFERYNWEKHKKDYYRMLDSLIVDKVPLLNTINDK